MLYQALTFSPIAYLVTAGPDCSGLPSRALNGRPHLTSRPRRVNEFTPHKPLQTLAENPFDPSLTSRDREPAQHAPCPDIPPCVNDSNSPDAPPNPGQARTENTE